MTLQALSLVGKVDPVQERFTLRLRDQWSRWVQDGWRVYMYSYMASDGSCVHGHLDHFQKLPLGGRPNIKPRDHGTPNTHNRWLIVT